MKQLLLAFSLLIIRLNIPAQASKISAENSIKLYGSTGIVGAIHFKEGYQFALHFELKRHALQLQFIQTNSDDTSSVYTKKKALNAILKSKAFTIMYSYHINKKPIRLFPSIGLTAGQESYRTEDVEFLGYYSSGGWFGSSTAYPHYQYHYNNTNFIGLKTSLTFEAKLTHGYFGCSTEVYMIINNHQRIDLGVTFNVLFGKIN